MDEIDIARLELDGLKKLRADYAKAPEDFNHDIDDYDIVAYISNELLNCKEMKHLYPNNKELRKCLRAVEQQTTDPKISVMVRSCLKKTEPDQ